MAGRYSIELSDLLERISRHVNVKANGCWIWGKDNGTHKCMKINGKMVKVYRVVYEKLVGPIPDKGYVCHNCPGGDNPSCCNPEHLWLGSHAENMHDAVIKGQYAHGKEHWNSKLTASKVREIFSEYHEKGRMQESIAKQFGVNTKTVSDIIRRKTWFKATEDLAPRFDLTRKRNKK